MKNFFIFLVLIFPLFVFSQVNDDFEDGNLNGWTESTTGHWNASTDNPINGTYSLHHSFDNSVAGHDQISIPFGNISIGAGLTTWRFQVRYEYNPSGDNTWNFFLFADQDASEMHPASTEINGYVVGVNYSNTDDFIKLWDVTNGSPSVLMNTSYDWQANITTLGQAAFEIKRTSLGEWSIFIDDDGGFDNLVQIGSSFIDQTHTNSAYTGICHEYTSSADQNLWFDDISLIGSADTDPPSVSSVETLSNNSLSLIFSENITQITAESLLNYTVSDGVGNPISATLNNNIVELVFANTFTIGQHYTLTVNNIEDFFGNAMNSSDLGFLFYEVQPFDIIINEIMCDVNPAPQALPALEYLELYNHSAYDINLSGWTIEIEGYTVKSFPDSIIPAREYAIICRPGFESDFLPYGMPIGITSFDLTTSGKRIVIRDNNNSIIEDITYSDEWYADDTKDDGGYSIERIDFLNFCGESDNWTATNDVWGGTPGRENSVYTPNPDNIAPNLLDLQVLSSNYLLLRFDDNISYASGSNVFNFTVNNGVDSPTNSYVDEADRTLVHLFFSTQFVSGQENTLIVEGIKDNCGNTIETSGNDFTYFLIYPVELWAQDENKLKIEFSETVDLSSGTNILNYFADKGIGNPEFISRDNIDTAVVYMLFSETFSNAEDITLNISGVQDINGNEIAETDMTFSFFSPVSNDIAINEVLFYPNTDGSDFVELYNRSGQRIDLINIQLASYHKDVTDSLVSISPLSRTNLYFEPDSYLAFTESSEDILLFYMSNYEENIIEISSLPSFNSDSGNVVLLFKDSVIIDKFKYNEDMHFKLLDNEKGVSLERVSFDKPTQDNSNWHSASETVGFATPAYKNSQYSDDLNTGNAHVTVEPYMFSPDNDGYDDYANINYTFQDPGHVATVIIFDARGRQVRQLANNLLLSTEGTIVWDGLYENNRRAPSGTYLIYFQVFDLEGHVQIFKVPVVSARRL